VEDANPADASAAASWCLKCPISGVRMSAMK
jgi:hypothetical protein